MHCRERWNDPVEENRNEEVLQDADETTAAQEQEPEITDEAVKEETAQAADARYGRGSRGCVRRI